MDSNLLMEQIKVDIIKLLQPYCLSSLDRTIYSDTQPVTIEESSYGIKYVFISSKVVKQNKEIPIILQQYCKDNFLVFYFTPRSGVIRILLNRDRYFETILQHVAGKYTIYDYSIYKGISSNSSVIDILDNI